MRLIGSLLVVALSAGCGGAAPAQEDPGDGAPPTTPVKLVIEEFLSNPTETSVQLALLTAEDAEVYVEYGEAGSAPARRTAPRIVAPFTLAVFDLDALAPQTAYSYRVGVRRPSARRPFEMRPAYGFRTLRRDRDAVFRFAYAPDSHVTGRWVRAYCDMAVDPYSLSNFHRTLANIEAADPDFVVAAGDNFMIQAPQMDGCPDSDRFGVGVGTARTQVQADMRYRIALAPDLWGAVARQVPFLTLLGNHDGEARFGDDAGTHGHFTDTRRLGREARRRHLADSTKVYDGAANGDLYYTFTSGDACFIILDVMSGPEAYPQTADDWTLGDEQLRWFEKVLEANQRTWTFVFIEHLAGGVGAGDDYYYYGRGGLRATVDGEVTSEFLGEQAVLQRLMRDHGVDVLFHAHDHVAVAGEKKGADGRGEGVFYVAGGQAAGRAGGANWSDDGWFREQYDYDGDGQADYLGPHGSRGPGFYLVTVHGDERVDIAYVASDAADPTVDGTVRFEFSIHADGTSTLPF